MARTKKSELEKPVWLKYSEEEVKSIIIKLSNKGFTSEKIGLILRDQYGIPRVRLYKLKIKKVIEEKGNFDEPTTKNLETKLNKIEKHYTRNKGDKKAERSIIITKSKLKKRKDYQNRV